MAEEVKIVVSQESRGNAISENEQKIQQLKQRMEELNRLETSYAQKGMDSAARSVRSERIPVARELRDLQREERSHQSERVASERQATREQREQAAITRAKQTRVQRVASAVMSETGVGNTGAAGIAMRGLVGASAASPIAMGAIAAALVGAGVLTVAAKAASVYIGQQDKDTALSNKLGEARGAASRGMMRMREYGSSGESHSGELSLREEIAAKTAHGQTLIDQAQSGLRGRVDKFLGTEFFTKGITLGGKTLFKPESARAIEENDKERARLQEQLPEQKQLTRDLYSVGAGQEVASQKARVEGRYKEAIAIDMASAAFKRYHELKQAGATTDERREGADLTLRQRQLEVMRGLGGLADARTGNAGLASLVSIAQTLPQAEVSGRLDQLISVVERSERASTSQSALQTHSR
ncbi:MAG TPA: hypothetical protein VF614_16660 [Chthoniobacteraceae bacterium]|jgi:hypothetical protein